MSPRTPPAPVAARLAVLLLASTTVPLAGQDAVPGDAPGPGQPPRPTAPGSARCADPGGGPAWPFRPPAVSHLEPTTRLAPVRVDRGARHRWVGLVELGDRFPFWLERPSCTPLPADAGGDDPAGGSDRTPAGAGEESRAGGARDPGGGPALAASVAGGAFSRFDLESTQNDFIEVHFRVGLRLLARLGEVEARAELYHVSSHLGDEYLRRTGRVPISTSREGVELLVGGRPLEGLRLYGGPGLLLRSSRDFEAASLRAGAEWSPPGRRGAFRPYLGAELFAWDELGWSPTASAEAGVRFGGRYRLAVTAGAGPSRAEQFFREDETLFGLSFGADL